MAFLDAKPIPHPGHVYLLIVLCTLMRCQHSLSTDKWKNDKLSSDSFSWSLRHSCAIQWCSGKVDNCDISGYSLKWHCTTDILHTLYILLKSGDKNNGLDSSLAIKFTVIRRKRVFWLYSLELLRFSGGDTGRNGPSLYECEPVFLLAIYYIFTFLAELL